MDLLKFYIKKYIKVLKPRNPFVSANHRLKCIFIHIPKCAGISIEEVLFKEKVGHKNYIDFKIHDTLSCIQYTKFTVVRDPIDRFVSAFYFLKAGGRNPTDLAWSQQYLVGFETPDELIEAMRANGRLLKCVSERQHFRPQYTFLLGERGQIEMDYILRFNHLITDFDELTKALGVSATLEHANKTKSVKTRELELKPESVEFLEEQYQEDYLRLGQYFS